MWAPVCKTFNLTKIAKFTVKEFDKIMKIKELETELKDIREKANKIEKEIEQLKKSEKKGKRWKPEKQEGYYFINDCGQVDLNSWRDDIFDSYRYFMNNCFQTEEETEEHAKNLETKMLLQKYADEHNEAEIVWENVDQEKYFLYYNYEAKKVEINSRWQVKMPEQIWFTSKEIAENAIKKIGEDRVIKYLKEM